MGENQSEEGTMDIIHNEPCPFCKANTLTLMDSERDVPYFGICHLFSMSCSSCKYHKADIEAAEEKAPVTVTFTIESEDDMNIRVVKSASATVKLPRIMTMESSELSNGFITNIEGLLTRAKKVLEDVRDNSDDSDESKKAKKLIKKLQDIMWGRDKLTITIEDPTGNSMIASEKAQIKTKKK